MLYACDLVAAPSVSSKDVPVAAAAAAAATMPSGSPSGKAGPKALAARAPKRTVCVPKRYKKPTAAESDTPPKRRKVAGGQGHPAAKGAEKSGGGTAATKRVEGRRDAAVAGGSGVTGAGARPPPPRRGPMREVSNDRTATRHACAPHAPPDRAEPLVGGFFEFHVRAANVQRAARRGAGPAARSFACDVCTAAYRHAFSLKRHFLRMHVSGEYVSRSDRLNCNIAAPAVRVRSHEADAIFGPLLSAMGGRAGATLEGAQGAGAREVVKEVAKESVDQGKNDDSMEMENGEGAAITSSELVDQGGDGDSVEMENGEGAAIASNESVDQGGDGDSMENGEGAAITSSESVNQGGDGDSVEMENGEGAAITSSESVNQGGDGDSVEMENGEGAALASNESVDQGGDGDSMENGEGAAITSSESVNQGGDGDSVEMENGEGATITSSGSVDQGGDGDSMEMENGEGAASDSKKAVDQEGNDNSSVKNGEGPAGVSSKSVDQGAHIKSMSANISEGAAIVSKALVDHATAEKGEGAVSVFEDSSSVQISEEAKDAPETSMDATDQSSQNTDLDVSEGSITKGASSISGDAAKTLTQGEASVSINPSAVKTENESLNITENSSVARTGQGALSISDDTAVIQTSQKALSALEDTSLIPADQGASSVSEDTAVVRGEQGASSDSENTSLIRTDQGASSVSEDTAVVRGEQGASSDSENTSLIRTDQGASTVSGDTSVVQTKQGASNIPDDTSVIQSGQGASSDSKDTSVAETEQRTLTITTETSVVHQGQGASGICNDAKQGASNITDDMTAQEASIAANDTSMVKLDPRESSLADDDSVEVSTITELTVAEAVPVAQIDHHSVPNGELMTSDGQQASRICENSPACKKQEASGDCMATGDTDKGALSIAAGTSPGASTISDDVPTSSETGKGESGVSDNETERWESKENGISRNDVAGIRSDVDSSPMVNGLKVERNDDVVGPTNENDEKAAYMESVHLNDATKIIVKSPEKRNIEKPPPIDKAPDSDDENTKVDPLIFRCNLCAIRCATRGQLWRHLQQHSANEHAGKAYSCALCDMTFSHRQNLARHRVVHAGECPLVFSSRERDFGCGCDMGKFRPI